MAAAAAAVLTSSLSFSFFFILIVPLLIRSPSDSCCLISPNSCLQTIWVLAFSRLVAVSESFVATLTPLTHPLPDQFRLGGHFLLFRLLRNSASF